jgi:hypothetical protein
MDRTLTTSNESAASDAPREAEGSAKGKKKYQAPSFRSERVFEVTALACGKVGPTQRSCRFNRKAS